MSNKRLETKFIVVHSSQTTPEQNISAEDLGAMHRKDGLLSIGYHKIIKRDGTIEDGRDIDTCGVHIEAKGEVSNQNSIAICLIGGKSLTGELDTEGVTIILLSSLVYKFHRAIDISLVIPSLSLAPTLTKTVSASVFADSHLATL